ncbi:hypothetical protein SPRG_03159 [Saprolegnia parasitica CBS 223.65]|uniref:TIR domain-containing protein n=1 Tax=Saprolegnia parasitica (strain CBS 223.65) TaxID=695850 RepID=A0A067CN52_SAPPC|nr:hypothetical protein SPRG_03159 [Saprolegnia parasitica CBS 223.65]KDO31943.1 hypothetical protein SPRG_03159 [Saprolegnia parasitica CBS 223.65]|eukprot:XP_012197141.1 hypothetical protein SPRG_03159 [Saprolegnia parasitica CBS 223.65]
MQSPIPIVVNSVEDKEATPPMAAEGSSWSEPAGNPAELVMLTAGGIRLYDEANENEVVPGYNKSTRSSWSARGSSLAGRARAGPPPTRFKPTMHRFSSRASTADAQMETSPGVRPRPCSTSQLQHSRFYATLPPQDSSVRVWRNSFFGGRLIFASVLLLACATASLVLHNIGHASSHCANMDAAYAFAYYISIASTANLLLMLPALFPTTCGLYKVQGRRVIRRPFLQLTEMLVVAQMSHMLLEWILLLVAMPNAAFYCHQIDSVLERVRYHVAFYAVLPITAVLYWQTVLFCRFRTHLKLQLGSTNDAKHSANLQGWLKTLFTLPAISRRSRKITELRTGLFKAASAGDFEKAQDLLDEATRVLGDGFATRKLYHGTEALCINVSIARIFCRTPAVALGVCAVAQDPLHVAVAKGDLRLVDLFLRYHFDVNALDKVARVNFNLGVLFKITRLFVRTQDHVQSMNDSIFSSVLVSPLHIAVQSGELMTVRFLLDHGANVDTLPRASFFKQSAVKPAIYFADDVQVIQVLLAHGTNLLYVSKASTVLTPLQRNMLTHRVMQWSLLEAHGGDVALTPLHAAAAANNVSAVLSYVKAGVQVDTLGELAAGVHCRTPLHWAAITGSHLSAKHLLAFGADANARDDMGRSPLHWAARNNHVAVVTLLLEHESDPNAHDRMGNPPLSVAAQTEGVGQDVIAALIAHGADLDFADDGGNTALHVALINENRVTAVSLLKCGANIMATNLDGKRAVDCTTSTELQFAVKKEAGSRDVMISYTHAHAPIAKRVRDHLVDHARLTCWMDTMDPSGIGGGAVWREEIARGIFNAKVVVAVVCDGYARSEWCLKELSFAKISKTPAVVLVVDPNGMSSEIERLVPKQCILPFPVSDAMLEDPTQWAAAFEAVLGPVRDALRHAEPPPLLPLYNFDVHAPARRVFIYYTAQDPSFLRRIEVSVQAKGFVPLLASQPLDTMDVREEADVMTSSSTVVFLVTTDELGDNDDAWRNLQKSYSIAKTHGKTIVPVFVGPQCLDFSKLYSLCRTPWHPFVAQRGFEANFSHLTKRLNDMLPMGLALVSKRPRSGSDTVYVTMPFSRKSDPSFVSAFV